MAKGEFSEYELFIDQVTTWSHGKDRMGSNVAKRPKDLIADLEGSGYEVLNTHGLPFNGTTYEVRKALPNVPNAFQICGHFKYVRAIYGNSLTMFFYPPECKGGSHLNKDELNKYTYKIETYDP